MNRSERREQWKAKWVIYRVMAGNRGARKRAWRESWAK